MVIARLDFTGLRGSNCYKKNEQTEHACVMVVLMTD